MKGTSLKHLFVGVAMLAAAGLALALTPTHKIADNGPKIDLETMIPTQFGGWQLDNTVALIMVSPDVQEKLDKIYNQTLSRTYINNDGERIMLSIAYGADQSDAFKAHKPETCYARQGFSIVHNPAMEWLATIHGAIPARTLVATQAQRVEPIIYWMVTGNVAVHSILKQKLIQLSYGWRGRIPDGVLVRVSSISAHVNNAHELQRQFIRQLLAALTPSDRLRLTGQLTTITNIR